MWRRGVLAFLMVLVPSFALAQDAPERLLPSGSQIYFQWDGFEKHRADFDKTALGRMMEGDTGKFLSYLVTYTRETLQTAIRNERESKMVLEIFDEVMGTARQVGKHGFLIGIEVKSIMPPQGQAVIVFPNNGKTMDTLMDKILKNAPEKPQVSQVAKRKVFSYSDPRGQVHFGWFTQGEHAVLTFGTEAPTALARRADEGDAGITKHALFKKVSDVKEFKTWCRGYVDLASTWELVGGIAPPVNQILTDLGLNGVESITLVSGFDGPAERSFIDINTNGKRTGILGLLNKKTIKLADLPPMPDNLTRFSASNFNPGNLYEGLVQVADTAAKVVAPGQVDVREFLKQIEGVIGVKLGEDIFGNFEGLSVSYSTATEGPLGLGAVSLFKVKNEKKLQEAIEALAKNIPAFPGAEVSLSKKDYRGVPIFQVMLKTQAELPVLTYTIHKGWFAMANYPQPLYGYILRSKGDLPAWKASAELTKALEAFPKEFTAVSMSDPRPGVEFLFSFVPAVATFANQFLPMADPNLKPFDTSVIPHAREAARHLFPNISVTTDDGRRIRIESRTSFSIPFLF